MFSTLNKIWVHWVPNDKIEAVSILEIFQLLLSFLWFIITKLEFNIFVLPFIFLISSSYVITGSLKCSCGSDVQYNWTSTKLQYSRLRSYSKHHRVQSPICSRRSTNWQETISSTSAPSNDARTSPKSKSTINESIPRTMECAEQSARKQPTNQFESIIKCGW